MIQTQNANKPHFGFELGQLGLNSCHQTFFKNLASSFTRYPGQLSSCTISEKINDPILRKFSDRQTDGQTNRTTDGRE